MAPDLPRSAVMAAGATKAACPRLSAMKGDSGPAEREIMPRPAAVANIQGTSWGGNQCWSK